MDISGSMNEGTNIPVGHGLVKVYIQLLVNYVINYF